jgi:hypothetical protein
MSDEDRPEEGEGDGDGAAASEARARDNVAAAVDSFATFRDELNALLREVRAGKTARAKRLAPLVGELARAVGRIADEEGKLDGVQGGPSGGVSQQALDLAAARREVCRRVAELRSGS